MSTDDVIETVRQQLKLHSTQHCVVQSRREYGVDAALRASELELCGKMVRQSLGVINSDAVVALFTERSLEMVTGAFGVLTAGAAYLPVDPSIPIERMRLMIEMAGARFALADAACEALAREACLGTSCAVVPIAPPSTEEMSQANVADLPGESGRSVVVQGGEEEADQKDWEGSLFCVMFTSGSTGRPKGVAITHAGVANYIRVFREIAGIDTVTGAAAARLLLVTSVMFVDHMQAGRTLANLTRPNSSRLPHQLRSAGRRFGEP